MDLMAKIIMILLLMLSSVNKLVVAPLPPADEKYLSLLYLETQKAINAVVSAAPPEKQKETLAAAVKHMKPLRFALDKAKESGDGKKLRRLVTSVTLACNMIKKAPPEKKLKMLEDSFNIIAAPNPIDCPNVDKAFCDMQSKSEKAVKGVSSAIKISEAQAAVIEETMLAADATIGKAYADGDEKKIAQLLAAYNKAADEVIAAAPAEKLNVLEKAFGTATATAAAGN